MKIKELCESERPREKMLSKGAAALSEAELLAVLLRSGTRESGVLDLAHRLLNMAEGRLTKLFCMSMQSMQKLPGIGPDKACSVMAAFELGRRFLEEEARRGDVPLNTPRRIYELMVPSMKGLTHEELWVLFLNKNNRLVGKQKLTSGGMDTTVIDNRLVMQACVERCAASVVRGALRHIDSAGAQSSFRRSSSLPRRHCLHGAAAKSLLIVQYHPSRPCHSLRHHLLVLR